MCGIAGQSPGRFDSTAPAVSNPRVSSKCSLGRFESACVERMRVRVRDVARARVAAGEGAESDVPTLGYAHTAETMRALALLDARPCFAGRAQEIGARSDENTHHDAIKQPLLCLVDLSGERVRAAYRAMQAASEMVLPAPDYAEATALPWLISLGGWQRRLRCLGSSPWVAGRDR
ncbi:hypothetical protein T492DRAFT_1138949 [Pavlovales sp. CCMP2436]|nr:hypothetical protein T492DRAFT_1138949 [Pavlovales sp. CCMP2436]